MSNESFMDKIRTFFGIRLDPPTNDFRNPIWSSDDEEDGDDLYTKQNMEISAEEMHQEFAKHMQDMFKSFGSIIGEIKVFFNEDRFESSLFDPNDGDVDVENFNSTNIRDYYLKPGYHNGKHDQPKEDLDLDGKITSNDLSGLFKQKEDGHKPGFVNPGFVKPFNGNIVPGRSFCKTIITTSVTKPDGTIETVKIIKNGNEIIEETTTSSPSTTGSSSPCTDAITNTSDIYNSVMTDLSSLFKHFY